MAEEIKVAASARAKSVKSTKQSTATPSGSGGGPLVPVRDILPLNLFLIPIQQTSFFPGMIVPFILPEGRFTKTVDTILEGNGYVGMVGVEGTQREPIGVGPATSMTGLPAAPQNASGSKPKRIYCPYGVAGKILKKLNLPDNQVSILVTGLERFQLKGTIAEEPHIVGAVEYLYEDAERTTELEAMLRSSLSQFKQISKDNPLISEEMKVALVNIDGPGKLADFMASVLIRDTRDYQDFLRRNKVSERLELLLVLLKKEFEVQSVQKRIQDEINQKVSGAQREFYLQEQLKLIQKELGREIDDRSKLIRKLRDRLQEKNVPRIAKNRIEDEFEKLQSIHEQSSEFSVTINYLDWATSLPWGVRSKDSFDLDRARKRLDRDHYGLSDVKERILEFLAVRKLKQSTEGTILCFVGPPGTGKTSLGKSIAKALNKKFFRFSVGGMRDEAEIKGHRRTYVGAMPGKVIQGLKRVETQNPVFLIDEIDKMGNSTHGGGDPSSALLEVLDPEQNAEFLDHYLDIPFDCSDVFFITTANTTDSIPAPLLDRMEVITLRSYTDPEKFQIARRHLIPKQIKKNGLTADRVEITEEALRYVISHYAREAGVRNLEKCIARIFRKVAYRVAIGKVRGLVTVKPEQIQKYLGLPPHIPEQAMRKGKPGVVTGLAWTQFGGDILFIESTSVVGKGGITLTGSLGDVMKESANIAYTTVRNQAERLGLAKDHFETHAFHLHVPSGAIPKDGPSAGVTMAASLYGLLTEKAVDPSVAMTGELTLSGSVLPVGGIKEKLLAARRSNIKTVLLPKLNARDLGEIEPELKEGLDIVLVSSLDECLRRLFSSKTGSARSR